MKFSPSLLVLALSTALPAFAQEAPDPLSFNVGVVSEYRYRGISQTRLKPALQGGIDYASSSGFYIGAWASTIKWIKDGGGDANVEIDVYGGYKTEVAPGLTLDVGLLQYDYPSNKLNPSTNTLELYGALSYGPLTAKYSHGTTNLFGFSDSKNSSYFDLTANFDLGDGLTLTPHVGHQTVKRYAAASYTDYSLTLAKDFSGLVLSAAIIGTDADKAVYTSAASAGSKFLGKTSLVVGLKKTF
ncbi:MAG: TorF family putative porin [Roseateles sp.]